METKKERHKTLTMLNLITFQKDCYLVKVLAFFFSLLALVLSYLAEPKFRRPERLFKAYYTGITHLRNGGMFFG